MVPTVIKRPCGGEGSDRWNWKEEGEVAVWEGLHRNLAADFMINVVILQ